MPNSGQHSWIMTQMDRRLGAPMGIIKPVLPTIEENVVSSEVSDFLRQISAQDIPTPQLTQ